MAKKYNKEKLIEKAAGYFGTHPSIDKFIATQDGQFFTEENKSAAVNHNNTMVKGELVVIKRATAEDVAKANAKNAAKAKEAEDAAKAKEAEAAKQKEDEELAKAEAKAEEDAKNAASKSAEDSKKSTGKKAGKK